MTGLGRRAFATVATDGDSKWTWPISRRKWPRIVRTDSRHFMVFGTAGTTSAGVIDPLPDLARFCRSENLWFHVDAAWGGAAILSPRSESYLAGIESADSITCDAHKWFSVPMGAGMFFCRHPDAVIASLPRRDFLHATEYPGRARSVHIPRQWSRRFIGLKLFLALAERGESGYIEMIEHQARMGDVLRELLKRAGWRIVNTTPLPLVCFTREGSDAAKFLAALHERQIAWMSAVRS